MAVLKVKNNNGSWDRIGGGSAINSKILVVTANLENNTVDYSASEIRTAFINGRLPVLSIDDRLAYLITDKSSDQYPIIFNATFLNTSNGEIFSGTIEVKEDKTLEMTTITRQTVPAPTESDYGKILSASAQGLIWVENSGGGAPSAEGVEF